MAPQPVKYVSTRLQRLSGLFRSKSTNNGFKKAISFKSRVVEGGTNIIARDAGRAQKLKAGLHPHGPAAFYARNLPENFTLHHKRKKPAPAPAPAPGDSTTPGHSIDVIDAGVTYTTSVGVGQPAQEFTLLIDTGSSNTWVGAGQTYNPTSTSQNTGNQVNVSYGSGSFSGTEYNDTVTLAPDLVIPNQSVGVASTAQGFGNGIDGILGIGPVDLTTGTVSGTPSVPTVTDNLYNNGTISTESIGISYIPTTSQNPVANGELTFGDVDPSKFTGQIEYVPITQTSPANHYWGIDQSITYGNSTTIMAPTSGIVDTGTTLLLIASDAFQAYQQATGATLDSATGLLTVTQQQYDNMQSLFFKIGNSTFELTPNAQIWPRALNGTLGGNAGTIYLVVGDLGSNSGSGLDFIDGFAFLQRFYSVYDTTNNQVGLATTQYTNATTN
ncbi:hypothetical protein M378DRAFT_15078 [Amanita muscaria Koide BX008]|uniref:Peptidase A1 domain-containing protein n=1 Tax=Amanita muscaria (strain Koide BX008) TaxID=946122 RepID=A0A0C2WCN7_AMAMK|nr:hypothetical protein M378DRAFT_15078 [Amanita muscaria Koide BX008]